MYAIEKEIRGEPPEVRLAVRQARTVPLVEDFGGWLRQQRARVSPKSRLGEKLAYIGNHWDGLQVFLTDGRVEMDNNVVENAIRPLFPPWRPMVEISRLLYARSSMTISSADCSNTAFCASSAIAAVMNILLHSPANEEGFAPVAGRDGWWSQPLTWSIMCFLRRRCVSSY